MLSVMTKQVDATKSRKDRTADTSEPVTVRVQAEMAKQLDEWRRTQEDSPGRPEAIRRLVEIGLTASRQSIEQLREAKSHAEIAKELAAEMGLNKKK